MQAHMQADARTMCKPHLLTSYDSEEHSELEVPIVVVLGLGVRQEVAPRGAVTHLQPREGRGEGEVRTRARAVARVVMMGAMARAMAVAMGRARARTM